MMTTDATIPLAAPSPVEAAGLLAGLVEVLIPGNADWPSAAAVGAQAALASRLVEAFGKAELDRLTRALLDAGAPFAGRDEAARVAIVRAFEAADPVLFGRARDITTMAYYESPFTAAAINAKGHPYELRPHARGYPLAPFDRDRDTPRHGRGGYVPTDAVRPVSVDGLDLHIVRTQAWGLQR